MSSTRETVRVALAGDLHYSKTSQGLVQTLFANLAERADVLVLCGDLTDYGLPEEAHLLARDLRAVVTIPIVAVLGNHDHESGKPEEIAAILTEAGVTMLDGDAHEICGIGFTGVKGFAGGFGRAALGSWGEEVIKTFVHEAVAEALRLEAGLARLRTPQRVAVLHYAPIKATVEGEPPEIFAFLGSSRLEEPLNRYPVSVIAHGHAHRGQPEGRTTSDVPVYNVSLPLLRALDPDAPPYRIVELPVARAG